MRIKKIFLSVLFPVLMLSGCANPTQKEYIDMISEEEYAETTISEEPVSCVTENLFFDGEYEIEPIITEVKKYVREKYPDPESKYKIVLGDAYDFKKDFAEKLSIVTNTGNKRIVVFIYDPEYSDGRFTYSRISSEENPLYGILDEDFDDAMVVALVK